MDRSIFSRYKRNKRELVLLEKAIEKLENRLEDVPIVNGKVSGSSKNFPYIETHMTVQMVEPKAADEISARLRDKVVRRDAVLKEVAEVEAFISKMPDGEKKEILSEKLKPFEDFKYYEFKGFKKRGEAVTYSTSNEGYYVDKTLDDIENGLQIIGYKKVKK